MKKVANQKSNRLKDIRILKKFSQLDVAIKLNKSEDRVSAIENGTGKMLLTEAATLSKLYEISLEDVYNASNQESEIY